MARSIYVNITHEKIALLRYMRANEERKLKEQGALQVSLQENIEVSLHCCSIKALLTFPTIQNALHRIQDSAKQQFETLSGLIAQFVTNEAHTHSQLLDTVLRMQDAGDGLWEQLRTRAQHEMEVSAEGVRRVLDDQVREMRYMVSDVKEKLWTYTDTVGLQIDALLRDTAEKVCLYVTEFDRSLIDRRNL